MRALITGASSGIGRDIAKELAKKGYDLVLVARNEERLMQLKESIQNVNVEVIPLDVSNVENCIQLHQKVGYVDILVNNAGFGLFGEFVNTDLQREIQMINTNIQAVHSLTKLFLQDMIKKDSGYILNVSSIAGHLPGPLMATYYATKHYVTNLSESINYELKKRKSNVKIATLNPGPVDTNFNNVANVKFSLKGLSSEYVARYTVNKMLKKKIKIIPGLGIKLAIFFAKITPYFILAAFTYNSQRRKNKEI